MATIETGNKEFAPNASANSSRSREDGIVSKTKEQAFPDGPQLPLENFEHYGDRAAGSENSIAECAGLAGKDLQQSYRAGLPKSASAVDKVSDR